MAPSVAILDVHVSVSCVVTILRMGLCHYLLMIKQERKKMLLDGGTDRVGATYRTVRGHASLGKFLLACSEINSGAF